ncbi:bifunctional glutamate N-acetyltransferase/amino-acid acetyltransferase ArgJ [Telmatospirillum sp.]|uniref:bifunctional glutamate N-acetyltransferase/amino-acid acetyltransferase ArgJ n=1 Tax=Telmatospirillum sp. TaxID=2079197 RepID=UPI002844FC51|nr:bifunctional glutamate N-acetyltransferase/amino-acid acetyltransferase ArgJ [Telmatospirillum sp.]MDR3437602.1 bifunctional glutamate N-acetyltransferase/amino-acid acetyltransferase ArgJ [Telmatospirillum sp.]
MASLSPLAPKTQVVLAPLDGVRLASHACGLRYQGRTDLMIAELAAGTTVAGVFTKSLTASAPVLWCREALKGGGARLVVVNSGNANAFTGQAGVASVRRTVEVAAKQCGCKPEEVFIASTGTIGVPLDDSKITEAFGAAFGGLAVDKWSDAAKAILTTDTYPKTATRTARIGGVDVRINGFCKGAGMIAPDMATMLAFVFTDATLPAAVLQELLAKGTVKSFNSITVDSDTSTSDTLLAFATGKVSHAKVSGPKDPALRDFRKKFEDLLLDLALQVVRDGEGASKFVKITVTGAASARAAKTIGMAIANSPLVKTAVAGEDANWGRIVMAVGKSGEKADRDRLSIRIGGVEVAHNGQVVAGYDEAPVTAHMKGTDIVFEVDIGVGRGKATVWTCDLTHDYIDINGSYRT